MYLSISSRDITPEESRSTSLRIFSYRTFISFSSVVGSTLYILVCPNSFTSRIRYSSVGGGRMFPSTSGTFIPPSIVHSA